MSSSIAYILFPRAPDASLILIYRSTDDCSNRKNQAGFKKAEGGAARCNATAGNLFV